MDDNLRRMSAPQVLRRVDKLLRASRIGEDDAARLRAAAQSGGLDDAIAEIRREHARARVVGAVEVSRLTPEEAAAILGRLEDGEDPRRLLRGVGSRRQGQDMDHLGKRQEPDDG